MDTLEKAIRLLSDKELVWSDDFENIRTYLGALMIVETYAAKPDQLIIRIAERLISV